MSVLTLRGLACDRGGRRLFEGLDLALAGGGAALVRGPNGVGKSSLLRLAAGLLPPAAGRILRDGAVAWMGEATALDAELPLGRALAFWTRLDGQDDKAGAAAIAAMGLAALTAVPVRMLSTGQQRRAALARVFAGGAPIWLLDEPGSGLDAAALAALEQAIAVHRAAGGILLAATHQPIAVPDAQQLVLGEAA